MKGILEETRTITIGGRAETFVTYGRLRDRAVGLIEAIQRIEASFAAGSIGSDAAWKDIGDLAADLKDVMTAQVHWLAEDDASILLDVEAVRRDIRNLNGFDPMDGAEG